MSGDFADDVVEGYVGVQLWQEDRFIGLSISSKTSAFLDGGSSDAWWDAVGITVTDWDNSDGEGGKIPGPLISVEVVELWAERAACAEKATTECPAGSYIAIGTSTTADDSECKQCPAGTFNSKTDAATACHIKSDKVSSCDAGYHVSDGLSLTEDDHTCQACSDGSYQPNDATTTTSCISKTVPTSCGAGLYIDTSGTSAQADDWATCAVCPGGTFKTAEHPLDATECTSKTTDCTDSYVLVELYVTNDDEVPLSGGNDNEATDLQACVGECDTDTQCADGLQCYQRPSGSTDEIPGCSGPGTTSWDYCYAEEATVDDECRLPGWCEPGEHSEADQTTCTACEVGKYNPTASSLLACIDKTEPTCTAGTFYSQPVDAGGSTADDWLCMPCPIGTYYAGASTDDDTDTPQNTACTSKTASEDSEETCSFGEEYHYGQSSTENDWYCAPKPRFAVLCGRTFSANARSLKTGLIVGVPQRVEPYTKTYSASMATPGYARVLLVAVVAVTGTRFISEAEKIPFPEGMPLLVLHDPPGGASFATFNSIQAESTFYLESNAKEVNWQVEYGLKAGATVSSKVKMVAGAIAGLAPGALVGVTSEAAAASFIATFGAKGIQEGTFTKTETYQSTSETDGWYNKNSRPLEDELPASNSKFEFTYTTSADIDRAGSISDAFLMPAATFTISEMFLVQFKQGEDGCLIRGKTIKTLLPRPDLDAFYFIQANDVETRTLPILKASAADVMHRLACNDGGDDSCCTEQDKGMGCDASNLLDYCDFLHGVSGINSEDDDDDLKTQRDASEGWQTCYSVVVDVKKTKCLRAMEQSTVQNKPVWEECKPLSDQAKCPVGTNEKQRRSCTIKSIIQEARAVGTALQANEGNDGSMTADDVQALAGASKQELDAANAQVDGDQVLCQETATQSTPNYTYFAYPSEKVDMEADDGTYCPSAANLDEDGSTRYWACDVVCDLCPSDWTKKGPTEEVWDYYRYDDYQNWHDYEEDLDGCHWCEPPSEVVTTACNVLLSELMLDVSGNEYQAASVETACSHYVELVAHADTLEDILMEQKVGNWVSNLDILNFFDDDFDDDAEKSATIAAIAEAVAAVEACALFTPTDSIYRAHDDWYNTLSRNYKKQEQANKGGSAKFPMVYDAIDSSEGGEPTPTDTNEVVMVTKLTGLAPKVLIDNAKDQHGSDHDEAATNKFSSYNAISFEGGGSAIEFAYAPDGFLAKQENEYELTDDDMENGKGIASVELEKFIKVGTPTIGWHLEAAVAAGGGVEHVTVVTKTYASSIESSMGIHFEDPDWGDYFVVTLYVARGSTVFCASRMHLSPPPPGV
jgi:hypothetical protein